MSTGDGTGTVSTSTITTAPVVTARDLITAVLRLLGVCATGETAPADEAEDALAGLNEMLDSWNTDRLNIYNIDQNLWDLVAGQQIYYIGPGAVDFNGERPIKIERANLVVTSCTPNLRVPMDLVDSDGWSAIKVRNLPSTIPRILFDNYDFPVSELKLWPYPNTAYVLELFTWKLLTIVETLDTALVLPPGYFRALKYNLAIDIAPEYGVRLDPVIGVRAQDSLMKIQSRNAPTPVMSPDPAIGRRPKGAFNYLTGT